MIRHRGPPPRRVLTTNATNKKNEFQLDSYLQIKDLQYVLVNKQHRLEAFLSLLVIAGSLCVQLILQSNAYSVYFLTDPPGLGYIIAIVYSCSLVLHLLSICDALYTIILSLSNTVRLLTSDVIVPSLAFGVSVSLFHVCMPLTLFALYLNKYQVVDQYDLEESNVELFVCSSIGHYVFILFFMYRLPSKYFEFKKRHRESLLYLDTKEFRSSW